jgi:hypothetical protein
MVRYGIGSRRIAGYYTLPGTKKRISLFDEDGNRIRSLENSRLAEHAFARAKLAGLSESTNSLSVDDWIVAKVCSEYLQSCERRVAAGSMSVSHHRGAVSFLNDLCGYCSALKVSEFNRSHFQLWMENHAGWKSLATHRSVIAIVLAAFIAF